MNENRFQVTFTLYHLITTKKTCLALHKMGHSQPLLPYTTTTPLQFYSKKHHKNLLYTEMDMQYLWILHQVQKVKIKEIWSQFQENLVDYSSRHHPESRNQNVRPYYVQK